MVVERNARSLAPGAAPMSPSTSAVHAERNRRLIELSRRFREELPGPALGAIVYPPVLFEEIRPDFWPRFPWKELAESYDVWLPMLYWSEIAAESNYGEGYRYTEVVLSPPPG